MSAPAAPVQVGPANREALGPPPLTIRLPVYEGPLELLLSLIERRELAITAVSLVEVTGQFLEHIESGVGIDLDQIASYLVIAAKLLLIKSQFLLPRPAIVRESELDDEPDPLSEAEALARQLREYQQIKVAARWLREREEQGLRSWPRRVPPAIGISGKKQLAPVKMSTLIEAFQRLLERPGPHAEPTPALRVTVLERMEYVKQRLSKEPRFTLRDLLPPNASVDFVVATFLALLEMFKRGLAQVEQQSLFGDIAVRRAPQSAPASAASEQASS